jgi:hypothetical protein
VLESTFRASGLLDVTVRVVSFGRHYSSTAEMIQRLKETAVIREPIEKLAETEREQAWAEIERELSRYETTKGVDLPGEFLIGVGTK